MIIIEMIAQNKKFSISILRKPSRLQATFYEKSGTNTV